MIEIIHKYESLPCPGGALAKTAKTVCRREGAAAGQATTVILCSDCTIRRLNRLYRGKDKATDVLSFPFGDDDLLGEVYISLQRAKIQAKKYGLTYEEELKRLLVHGLLHLMGYDHHKKADREAMEEKERAYAQI
ncbi:MAG: rRNA maturation RNase YbeY [Chitinispirillia bacterium]|nr:rRNA maturation RNase YbeY [Chitinispirillia bacterium]MCL2268994.1 rRNA maturation RNase YbeY [Chitinispirillia bacterium]